MEYCSDGAGYLRRPIPRGSSSRHRCQRLIRADAATPCGRIPLLMLGLHLLGAPPSSFRRPDGTVCLVQLRLSHPISSALISARTRCCQVTRSRRRCLNGRAGSGAARRHPTQMWELGGVTGERGQVQRGKTRGGLARSRHQAISYVTHIGRRRFVNRR